MLAVKTYHDRVHGGRVLAQHLASYLGRPDVLVLALPRGGLPVGLEVAKALHAPLDVFLVRKLGVPGHEELAMGAIASGGVRLLNVTLIEDMDISARAVETVSTRETAELKRREQRYRAGRAPHEITGRCVILVDDGLATGFTMRAAIKAVRALQPAWLAVAVPVGAPETCDELAGEADEVICPLRPSPFQAVGLWYEHFGQSDDDDVCAGLAAAAKLPRDPGA